MPGAADHAAFIGRRNAQLHGQPEIGGMQWVGESLPVAPVALCWFEGTFKTEVADKTMPRAVIQYDLSDRAASAIHIASVEALPLYPPALPADRLLDRLPATQLAQGRP